MINLGLDDKPIMEDAKSVIHNTIKDTANIDTNEIRDIWSNSQKGVLSKVNETETKTLGNASDSLNKLSEEMNKRKVNNSSIIARAKNSVMQFPVYISQSIRVNEAHIISKYFERVYASIMQTVISQNSIIDEDEVNDLVFLKGIHTNLNEAAKALVNKYYEPIDESDAILCESVFYSQKISDNCTLEFAVIPSTNKDLLLENARLLNDPLTGFSYIKEATTETTTKEDTPDSSHKFQTTKSSLDPISNNDLEDMACDRYNIDAATIRNAKLKEEEIRKTADQKYPNDPNKTDPKRAENKRKYISNKIKEKDDAQDKIDQAVSNLKRDIKNGNLEKEGLVYRNGRYCRNNISTEKRDSTKTVTTKITMKNPNDAIDAPKLLRDVDIKKTNGMLPYSIEATFRVKLANGDLKEIRYILGVKTVLHLIRAQDLAEDLDEIITGNIRRLQRIRYKTGEISFMDYFFNLKGLKSDAMKNINYNKRWLNTLKRLGEYNKLHGSILKNPAELLTNSKVPIPNGTLILSQLDVNNIVNETGIDISDVSIAGKLVKSLFLIGIAIVDSTAGTMRVFLPEQWNDWDVQSLASIDADLAKTDNSSLMKELNKMVNK